MTRLSVPDEARDVHIYYHRPPDRTDRFVQGLVHDDGYVKVTFTRDLRMERPLVIGGEVALEDHSQVVWFTFPGAWHDIGRFHRADGTLSGVYANILIPCLFEPGGDWYTTDLFLDLWMPATEGVWPPHGQPLEPEILDRDELDRAEQRGWISGLTAQRARREALELVQSARAGRWPPDPVSRWTRERVMELEGSGRGL